MYNARDKRNAVTLRQTLWLYGKKSIDELPLFLSQVRFVAGSFSAHNLQTQSNS